MKEMTLKIIFGVVLAIAMGMIIYLSYLPEQSRPISCNDINWNPPELTFDLLYCQGDMCRGAQNKDECDTKDVMRIENGRIVSGTDGKPDCVWIDNACKPNI